MTERENINRCSQLNAPRLCRNVRERDERIEQWCRRQWRAGFVWRGTRDVGRKNKMFRDPRRLVPKLVRPFCKRQQEVYAHGKEYETEFHGAAPAGWGRRVSIHI